MVERWHDFYLTAGGATAALVGLLFVALSLHLRSVAANPGLRSLARQTFTSFLAVLMISLFVLIPQTLVPLGIELLFVGALVLAEMLPRLRSVVGRRRGSQRLSLRTQLLRSGFASLAYLGILGVGLAFLLRQSDGLYWLVAVVVILILTAVRNAWDLLVELSA
jgi:modulator of FtsH protease